MTGSADNPVNHFPTYQPSEERIAAIQASLAEENNPLNIHYDASREVRAKGAGFYQFSLDEETRKKQMEELKKAREETEKTRQEVGAADLRPGEVEGLVAEGSATGVSSQKSRALEKRKREIEERRKLLEAKRRRKNPISATLEPSDETPVFSMPPDLPGDTPEHPPEYRSTNASAGSPDPFAALEAQTMVVQTKGKVKNTAQPQSAADDFLASLERDIMAGRKT